MPSKRRSSRSISVAGKALPRGVVGRAEPQQFGSVRPPPRAAVRPAARSRSPSGTSRSSTSLTAAATRYIAVGRCDRDCVVDARPAEDAVGQIDRLVAAVADEDTVGGDALACGEQFPQPLLARIGIAVDAVVVGTFVGVEPHVDALAAVLVACGGVGGERADVGADEFCERSHRTPPSSRMRTASACASSPSAPGHGDDRRGEYAKPFAREFLISDAAQEAVDVHAAVRAGAPARGERVVRPRGVVAGAFGGIIAHEDAAGRRDAAGGGPRVAQRDDQVFGGVGFGGSRACRPANRIRRSGFARAIRGGSHCGNSRPSAGGGRRSRGVRTRRCGRRAPPDCRRRVRPARAGRRPRSRARLLRRRAPAPPTVRPEGRWPCLRRRRVAWRG